MDPWQGFKNLNIESAYVVPSVMGKTHIIANRYCYGLCFAYGGRIVYEMNGVRTLSDPSSAILLPMGATYRIYREESGHFPLINFTADEGVIEEILRIPLKHPEIYLKDFEALRNSLLSENNPARSLSILYGIFARLSEEEEKSAPKGLLLPVMDYLGAHLYDPELTNEQLAKQANISEVYFRRLFKKTYGISPHQYIIEARIRHAKQLLVEQTASVTAIAEACGFSGVYHFCRAFRQITGMTPKEYEKSQG